MKSLFLPLSSLQPNPEIANNLPLEQTYAPFQSQSPVFLVFLLLALNALFQLASFISLSIFVAKHSYCTSHRCTAVVADTAVLALGYVVWVAEATMVGLELSKIKRDEKGVLEIKQKLQNV